MKAAIFAFLEVFFLIGALASTLFEHTFYWFVLFVLFSLISLFAFRVTRFWFIFLAFALFFFSIYRFHDEKAYFVQENNRLQGREIIYSGVVVDMPVTKEYGSKITVRLQNGKGKIFLYTAKNGIKYGEKISFKGNLKPYGESVNYLIKERVVGELSAREVISVGFDQSLEIRFKKILFDLRYAFNDALKKALPGNESALASGIILGEKQFLSADFTRQLQGSGTSHIVALSGYNITIIIGLFALCYPFFSRKINLLLPILFITSFAILTGGAPSVVRASIMGLMPIVARYLGRSSDAFLAILFSAALMVAFNPFLVLYDVGFQLSFIALVGMIYLGNYISYLFIYLPSIVGKVLAETIGAQIAVLPLILYYFGYVSIISPVSNLLVLFLIPFAMLASFIVGCAQLIFPAANFLFIFPAHFVLQTIVDVISYFGDLPFAVYKMKLTQPYIVVLVYLLLIDVIFLINNRKRKKYFEKAV